jgi:hypothetical protein
MMKVVCQLGVLMNRFAALPLAAIIFAGAVYAIPSQQAFAHTFSGDESATFLTHIEGIRVQLDLVQSNLGSDVELAQEHAHHAADHLDMDLIEEIEERNERLAADLPAALEDLSSTVANSTAEEVEVKVQNIDSLLGETVAVRIDSDQIDNSTVWALVLANMADAVISHYGAAYGISAEDDHGEQEESGNETHDEAMETPSENMTHDVMEAMDGNTTIVSITDYQIAQGTAANMQELFHSQVKGMAPANSTEFVADLEAALDHLKQGIDDREPPTDIELIVHSEVHPSLQSAYNLQVIPEFPLPLLMVVTAITGIVAATRLNALWRR